MFSTGWSSKLFPSTAQPAPTPSTGGPFLPPTDGSVRPEALTAPQLPARPQIPFAPPVVPPTRPKEEACSVIELSLIKKAEEETDPVAKVQMYMEIAMKRIETGLVDETMIGFCKKAYEVVYAESQKYSYYSKIEFVLPILFNEILKISEKIYQDEHNLAIEAIEVLSPFSAKLQHTATHRGYDMLNRVPNLVHKIICAGGQTGSEVFLVKIVTNTKQIERQNFSNLDGSQRAKLDKILSSLKTNNEHRCYDGYYTENSYNYNYITRSEAESLFTDILYPQQYANNFTAILGGGVSKVTGLKSSKDLYAEYIAIEESARAALPLQEKSPEPSEYSYTPPSSSDEARTFNEKWLAKEEEKSPVPVKQETDSFSGEGNTNNFDGNFFLDQDFNLPPGNVSFPQDFSD